MHSLCMPLCCKLVQLTNPFDALVWSEVARLNGQAWTFDIAYIAKLKFEDEQIVEAEALALRCVESGYATVLNHLPLN